MRKADVSDADRARIRDLLTACYDEIGEGRTPDLDVICADDRDLRPVVEKLLADADVASGGAGDSATDAPLPEIPGYDVQRRLATGGMATVFVAVQESLGREVAVKVLSADRLDDPLRRLRFRREAEMTAAIDHPNIVPVYETGFASGHLYIAMRLVDGPSLDRLDRRLTSREVADIGRQVATGLGAAHEVGIVHRDVKPANIILEGTVAQIVDFGLARRSGQATLTREGQAPGTLSYMPPELLSGKASQVDPRRDIYSLGATLYQLLADRPPFEADDSGTLIKRVLLYDPPTLDLGPRDHDLRTIVMRALEKTPERRFQSAGEIADELTRYLEGRPILSKPAGPLRRLQNIARRNRVATGILIAGLLAVIVLLGVLWSRMRSEAADRERRRGLVVAALDDGRYVDGWRLARTLGTDTAPDRAIHQRVRAVLDLEALLDRLVTDPMMQDVGPLRPMVERVRQGSLAATPRAQLASCFFEIYRQDDARVRAHLATPALASFPATTAVVRSLIGATDDRPAGPADSTAPDAATPDAATPDTATPDTATPDTATPDTATPDVGASAPNPEDHVFAAVATLIHQRSLEDANAEIERALEIDQGHVRAHLVRAIVDSKRNRLDLAERGLQGVLHSGLSGPKVREWLASIAFLRGDDEAAFAHSRESVRLTRAMGLPPSAYSDLILAHATLWRGDYDACSRMVAKGRRAWPDSHQWTLCSAFLNVRLDERDAAVADFRRVIDHARLPWLKRRARLGLLELDAATLARTSRETGEEDLARDRKDLDRRATDLAAVSRKEHDRYATARALFVRYGLCRQGQTKRRLALLRQIFAVEPEHALAVHALAQSTYLQVSRLRTALAADGLMKLGEQMREARDRARTLFERTPNRRHGLGAMQREEVAVYVAYLSLIVKDTADAEWSVDAARDLQDARSAPEDDPNVRIVEVVADRLKLD